MDPLKMYFLLKMEIFQPAMFVYQRVTILSTEINLLQVRSAGSSELKIFSLASGRLYVSFLAEISHGLGGWGWGGRFRRFLDFWLVMALVMVGGTYFVGLSEYFWSCWAWSCKGRDARRLSSDPPCITVKYIHPEIILKWKLCCLLSWSRVVPIMRMSCLAIQCPFAMKQSINSDLGRYVCKLFQTCVTKAMRKIWVWDVKLISASSSR